MRFVSRNTRVGPRRLKLVALATAASAVTLGVAGAVVAGPADIAGAAGPVAAVTQILPKPPGPANNPITGPLTNHGGPVQTSPQVYVVFWDWTSDPEGEMPYLDNFLSTIGNSPWLETVNQYDGSGSTTGAGYDPVLAGTWSDAKAIPNHPSNKQVEEEAARAATHFHLNGSVDDQVVVATPTGHSSPGFPSQFCAYHSPITSVSGNMVYTNLPYQTDAGGSCGENDENSGANGTLDGISIVEGHELAESITDPELNAWFDASGNEVADKCEWYDVSDITTSKGTFAVQPLWSNALNECSLGVPGGWAPQQEVANTPISGSLSLAAYGTEYVVAAWENGGHLYTDLDYGTPFGAPGQVSISGAAVDSTLRPSVTIDPNTGYQYLAYTNSANSEVEVAQWTGGTSYSSPTAIGQSSSSPSICSFNGDQYVAFRGYNNDNVYLAINAGHGYGAPILVTPAAGGPGASTAHGPAITCGTDIGLVIAWTNNSNSQIQYLVNFGLGFGIIKNFGHTTSQSPTLAYANGTTWMGWAGPSSDGVFYAHNADVLSVNSPWSAQGQVTGALTLQSPGLAPIGNTLWVTWTGKSSNELWYSSSDNP